MSYITREPVCWGPPSPAIEVPNTRIAVFANTVDLDEMAHNETESTVFAFYSLKFEPFFGISRRNFVTWFLEAVLNCWI